MADDKEKRTPAPSRSGDDPPAERPPNETVPGGRYIVNGQTVDAEGRPIESA